jgi:hypothetical protein
LTVAIERLHRRLLPLRRHSLFGLGAWLTLALLPLAAFSQAAGQVAPVPLRPGAAPAVAAPAGAGWRSLTPEQRKALAPLERDWPRLDDAQKQKWIEVAGRMPKMPDDERRRIQDRMSAWSNLSPAERGAARLRYLQAQGTDPTDRRERWEAYQALPRDQQQKLAARAAQPASATAPGTRKAIAERSARADRTERAERGDARPGEKSNLVPNPSHAAPPRSVAPTVVQARPGASTNLVSKHPAPPLQLQTGMPKITATPGFVDTQTLLPRRGPQGAAAVAVGASGAPQVPVPRP